MVQTGNAIEKFRLNVCVQFVIKRKVNGDNARQATAS